ncbi:MAG: alpha-L-fucosidase [Lentisphaeria bacterium]|nr:alpha-L-fucosidase [Lentisphaeria bacterium]
MLKVNYALFYDNHTEQENPDVGKNFDVEHFVTEIEKCGVNYITFHARCNRGLAYYDTKIGTRHPALDYDLFGQIAHACQKKNIALTAYLNGGISNVEALQHPEWQTLYMPGHSPFGKIVPNALTMCYNTPYRDHLLSMIREITDNYPVAGFFIDCLQPNPCICPTCIKMMKEQNIDWNDFDSVVRFSQQSILKLCEDITREVKSKIKEPMLFFNGPVPGSAREQNTFFDCECLPTSIWGYEFLPTLAHVTRNIDPAKQVLNMTGRFNTWGDFGGLRTADSLKFDLFYGLAHGMRPNIGGHFHPRGDKDQAVFDRIREVYADLQKYDKWYEDAVNQADTAIVYPYDNGALRYRKPLISAVRMLEELKVQFDIILADCDKSWDQYKLLILPETLEITDLLVERIRKAVANGAALFACGKNAAEKLGDILGIEYCSDADLNPVYFKMQDKFSQNLEDMVWSLYAGASKATLKDAQQVATLVKPYYNKSWIGTHAIYYTPPQEETNMPFLTVKGKCVWCSGDLFAGYYQLGAIQLRTIFKNIIEELHPEMIFKNVTLPSFVRTTLTEQKDRFNINLIAYAPEKRGATTVVEEPLAVVNAKFKVRTDNRVVKSVTLAPDGQNLDYTVSGNYTEITLPVFQGYTLVSINF